MIQPNKACWILVDGRVADVSEEGWNDEGTAFSHGIFVKQWVKFRTHNFCPDKSEREMASGIERRAKQIFAEKPEILVETDEEGHENLFAGDLAHAPSVEIFKAFQGVEQMPNGGGVFFLQEFGTRSEQTSAIPSKSNRASLCELLDIWSYGNKSICCFAISSPV